MFSLKKEDNINEEEKLKQELVKKSQISILLNNYNDIFSDFDPRPYNTRALSDDFLLEAKKAARDKEENLQLDFLIKKSERKLEHEILIKRRLREHFKKHAVLAQEEVSKVKKEGYILIGIGVLMMFITVLIYSNIISFGEFTKSIIIIITEPAGWFLFWIGGEKLVYEKKEKMPDLDFYKKMSIVEIVFHSY